MKLCAELMPVLKQLQAEGFTVYTYKNSSSKEYHSLYWFENGRLLNIQPDIRRDTRYCRDCFNIGVSYIPSKQNGSGCQLSPRDGVCTDQLLRYRGASTWVHGVANYNSMEHFLRSEKILAFFPLNSKGERA